MKKDSGLVVAFMGICVLLIAAELWLILMHWRLLELSVPGAASASTSTIAISR